MPNGVRLSSTHFLYHENSKQKKNLNKLQLNPSPDIDFKDFIKNVLEHDIIF